MVLKSTWRHCFVTLALQAMHTAPKMTGFLVRKTSTLKEYLGLQPLPWQRTTAQLNPPHIFILKKFQFSQSFFKYNLTCISMETGYSCRARWRIAVAAHILCVLIGQFQPFRTSITTLSEPYCVAVPTLKSALLFPA